MSYAGGDPDHKVKEAVTSNLLWAEGEYQEHDREGLFEAYPSEGELILDMLALSEGLRDQAAAMGAGELSAARAHYFSAEAVAQYAARMPHMLEARMKEGERHEQHTREKSDVHNHH